MSKDPDPEQLIRFVKLLKQNAPEDYEPWFFRVEAGGKAPDTSYGSWKDEDARLSGFEAVKWMREGGNVGIAGTPNDRLVNVDIDDEDETTPDDMKPTLMARSRSRTGIHGWYFESEPGEIPNIPTDDAGEIRANWQYVVTPGSYVETDPDEVPEEHREMAGYYTIEREEPAAGIDFEELPEVFREKHQKEEQATAEPDLEEDTPEPVRSDTGSALFRIEASDVVQKERGSVDTGERWSSLFHGSDTGANMSLSDEGLLQCWRHEVAHNGLQALTVLSGYHGTCEQVGTPHRHSGAGPSVINQGDQHIWEAWKYAKESGYIPNDDPVPYRALLHIARSHELCPVSEIPKEYDPENGERLPASAYDPALSIIENHYDLPHGRKKTTEISDGKKADVVSSSSEAAAKADGGTTTATPTDDDTGPSVPERPPLWQLVKEEVLIPLDPDDDDDVEQIDDETARDRLCDLIEEEYHFLRPRSDTRGWRDTLYVYSEEDGIYEPHGESFIQSKVEQLVGAWSTNQRVREIVGKIERRSRVDKRELKSQPERLVVANGILDLTTGTLDDHDPGEYHQTMVNVDWNPDAECPNIDEFLHDIVEPQDVPKLYRLIAHSLYKEYAAEKAAMLLGDGRNGKSVFLSLVERFLGNYNVSNQSLQALNEDEWAANNLVGKLANVHPDMSDQTVQTMQMFKKLTGRDTVSANVKFEEPIRFENYATLIFACNRMPVLKDDTRGNWRRWILIDFPNTFEPDAEETEEKQVIMDRITSPSELQGLLVRCVEEIQAWDAGRAWFPTAPSWEEARKRIRRAAEPVYDFAHACLEDGEGCERTDEVRRAYQAYASSEGLPPISRESFGRQLLNQTDYTIEKKQKRFDGVREQVYQGVSFTSRGRQLANGGAEEESHEQQDRLGGPQGRADRLYGIATQHCEDGPVSHDMLVGMAIGQGMSHEQAEAAIEKAKKGGQLMNHEEGYLPT